MGESQWVRRHSSLTSISPLLRCNWSFIYSCSSVYPYSDFGGIFAELLPGNFAKLQPPEGQDLTQGLEVKVQLGSVWKQSLTELSGGQRCVPIPHFFVLAGDDY